MNTVERSEGGHYSGRHGAPRILPQLQPQPARRPQADDARTEDFTSQRQELLK
jgi:hypothetical protein